MARMVTAVGILLLSVIGKSTLFISLVKRRSSNIMAFPRLAVKHAACPVWIYNNRRFSGHAAQLQTLQCTHFVKAKTVVFSKYILLGLTVVQAR